MLKKILYCAIVPFFIAILSCGGGNSNPNSSSDTVGSSPTITVDSSALAIIEGNTAIATITIEDPDGNSTISSVMVNLSERFSITQQTSDDSKYDLAVVNAVQSEAGTYQITITAEDTDSNSIQETITVYIEADPLTFALDDASHAVKTIAFTWGTRVGNDYYQLSVNPDGQSGYSTTSITTTDGIDTETTQTSGTVEIPAHLTDWQNASYIMSAYKEDGTLYQDSDALSILDAMQDVIGFKKSDNLDAGDAFGTTIAVSGDGSTLIVGATEEDGCATSNGNNCGTTGSGAVYVFSKGSDSSWSQVDYLKADNAGEFDSFGDAIAIDEDGTTIAIGAAGENGCSAADNDDSCSNVGAVYIFTKSDSDDDWSQHSYLKADNAGSSDNFGIAVALNADGTTLAVGATKEDGCSTSDNSNSCTDSGAVYVFTLSSNTWSQHSYLKTSNVDDSDEFGNTIAIDEDGNTLAIGASLEDSCAAQSNDSCINAGAAYVFTLENDIWSQFAYLKADNADANDNFGNAIGISYDGTRIAVAASNEDGCMDSNATEDNGNNCGADNSGAAYIFDLADSSWSQSDYLKADNADASDGFGYAIAISGEGDTLAVGAYLEDGCDAFDNANDCENYGAGYSFTYSSTNSSWSQDSYIKKADSIIINGNDQFGQSLSLSEDGNTLVVGAPNENKCLADQSDTTICEDAGAAYIY